MEDIVFYYPEGHQAHASPGHPERPERVEAVRQALQEAGWWDRYPKVSPLVLSREFIATVHEPTYLDALEMACRDGAWLDMDTYTTPASWQLALNAAGGTAAVVREVWMGRAQTGLALSRPPGHHATRRRGMGFCLLNNVAIAAQYLLQPPEIDFQPAGKLAIIDLDLHHGNGTQDIFWQRRDVFYFSTHQNPLYPGTGFLDEIGAGEGQGYTANFPLPPATGDQGFQAIMDEIILPLLDRYRPQMLLLSVGFDPHWRDPLGHLMLSAAGYGRLISSLAGWARQNCQGKVALILEGGYDLEAAGACMQASVAALLQEPWQDPLGPSPRPEGKSYLRVLENARKIWGL